MPTIIIKTPINSKIECCFDLSRSIDLHVKSMSSSNEKAIGGKKSGLINLSESVTWSAKHFGLTLKLTSKITQMNAPFSFTDQMTNGPFRKMTHHHYFKEIDNLVEMTDVFKYENKLLFGGFLTERLFLNNYMRKLLCERNKLIKLVAETKKS